MMATLKVPPLAVPSAYMKRGNHLSNLESCSGSVDLANSNKNLIDTKQTTDTLKLANGIGSCLDNIAFEIEDEISKMESKNGFSLSIKTPSDITYSDAIASTSKDEICFAITGSKNDSISSSGDTQRKEPDISVNDSTVSSRRSKSVQIMDFPNKKEAPKESYLKRFQLHFMVAITFLFIIGNLSAVWHFHEEERLAIKMGQRISFDTSSRVLTFKDAPWSSQQFKGYLANDIPKGWLPLDCSTDKKNVSKMCMRWKGLARVNLEYHLVESLSCFNVKWKADNKNQVLRDCYTSSLDWFGSSNTGDYQWPLQNVSYFHLPNFTYNDINTFGHLSEHFWLSSNGIAILLNESTPFHVSWKKNDKMQMCINSNQNFETRNGILGAPNQVVDNPNRVLHYRICYGRNIMETYSVIRKYFSRNSTKIWPNDKMFEHPHWIAKAAGNDVPSMSTVTGLAMELTKRNLSCSTIEVFGKWESEYGNLEFNEFHFGNLTTFMKLLGQTCDLMLPIRPYIHHNSQRFSEGIEKNYFIMDAGGRVPGLVQWSNGVGAMLDASDIPAVDWFMQKLKQLRLSHRIDSFHFTYDGNMSLPFQPHFKIGFHSGELNKRFSEIMAAFSDKVIVDHVSHAQNSSVFVTVQSVIVQNDTSMCFTNLIEKSFVLSILGYPYIMSDGISFGDGTSPNRIPNEILYQRWLQASIFFPAIRFSVTPWSYSKSVLENVKKLLAFRQKEVIPYLMKLKNETLAGVPFIRPIWWSYPNDFKLLMIKDQFLVGDTILVAPLFCDQPSHRNIYIPAGIWEDINKKKVVDGPMWLVNYSISITEVPYFYRMPQHKRVG